MVYYVGEDPLVQVTDEGHENFYDCVNAMTYSPCLNNTSLEPGESKDGELFFEIPDEHGTGRSTSLHGGFIGEQNGILSVELIEKFYIFNKRAVCRPFFGLAIYQKKKLLRKKWKNMSVIFLLLPLLNSWIYCIVR